VLAVKREAYAKIAQAGFAVAGDGTYPDGTFTLRLSYGQVQGYRQGGRDVPSFTEVHGLFARADEHQGKPPYRIPERWMEARAGLSPRRRTTW
jgi:Peptidase S46